MNTGTEELRARLHTYFKARRLFQTVGPGLAFTVILERNKQLDLDKLEAALIAAGQDTEIDQELFAKRARSNIAARKAGKKPTGALETLVRQYQQSCLETIASFPPSREKSELYFRTFLNYEDSIEFAFFFKSELKTASHPAVKPFLDMLQKGGVGNTAIGYESLGYFQQYRFFETYAPELAGTLLAELQAYFRDSLITAVTDWDLMDNPIEIRPPVRSVAFDLWLVSRSEPLASALRPQIRDVLSRLPKWQDKSGWFPVDIWHQENANSRALPRRTPSPEVTALCLLALCSLSDDRHIDQIKSASKWLAQEQKEAGHWADKEKENVPGGDVFTTLVALRALRRSGLPADHFQVRKGENWLLQSQHPLGFWEQRYFDPEFLSGAILEYWRDLSSLKPVDTSLLRLARDFFRKAEELALEGGSSTRKLAIIAAFHSIEFFLYGVMSDVRYNIDYFRESGSETIGFRVALGNLEKHLKDEGKIAAKARLRYRQQLNDLASRRDQIVHKGHDIDQQATSELLHAARSFITHYAREFLDLDLFQ